jgi:hypothetical protein
MSTTTFADRLKELMVYHHLNKNSLSVRLGFTANTSIVRLANHPDRYPSFDLLCTILNAFPEISSRWLILGVGKMLEKDEIVSRELWTAYFKREVGNPLPQVQKHTDPTDRMRIYGYADCEMAVDVFGDSMSPRINSGDIVLCKEVKSADPITFGETYLIITLAEPVVRYIKSSPSEDVLKLGAENPRFEDYEVRRSEILALYRVKGIIRREAV